MPSVSTMPSHIRVLTTYTLKARAHWPLCLATGGRVFVAGIFIPVGNHYFQALASTLQFVAQVCDRLWLVPSTGRAFLWLRSAASTLGLFVWKPLSRVGNFAEYGNFAVAATCRPSVLGSATKTRPPVAKQSGQCARALRAKRREDAYTHKAN